MYFPRSIRTTPGATHIYGTQLTNLCGKYISISNYNYELSNLILGNKLTTLNLHGQFSGIKSYGQLFELLKQNTSIHTIQFAFSDCFNAVNKNNCKLLHELLNTNTTIKKLYLIQNIMENEDWFNLVDALKDNIILTDLELDFDYNKLHGYYNVVTITNAINIWKKIVGILKVNTTLKNIKIVTPTIYDKNYEKLEISCISTYIVELLTVNKTLNKIHLNISHNLKRLYDIIDILKNKNNTSVTDLCLSSDMSPYEIDQITQICELNKHNIRLKELMLNDL